MESPRPAEGARGRLGSPRARLFVALELPGDVRSSLAAWRDAALAGRADLRPVPAGALHVTLAFLGYRPERQIEPIAAAAFAALEGRTAPSLRPGDVVAVPPRAPRLFALDLHDDGGRARGLQAAVARALEERRHYEPERRPFWPHVTLARVKRDRRATPLELPPSAVGTFEADEVTLYRSILRREGARYEPLATARLG